MTPKEIEGSNHPSVYYEAETHELIHGGTSCENKAKSEFFEKKAAT